MFRDYTYLYSLPDVISLQLIDNTETYECLHEHKLLCCFTSFIIAPFAADIDEEKKYSVPLNMGVSSLLRPAFYAYRQLA